MGPSVFPGPFGRYMIERELGRGATAVVYLARDTLQGQLVAIKILRPELAQTTAANLFLREMRRHSTLHHPHIVPVIDAGDHDGNLYIALPYLEAGTLRDRLSREKQLPISDAISIARIVGEALEHAHRQGLIHRDVKPENILFSGSQPCLADFGIAKAVEKALGETSSTTGIVRGTWAYISPEQASADRDYDGRTDVYSLGCVLYEMLAGVPAFIGATPEAVLSQRFAHAPRELRVYRPRISDQLDSVVKKALEFAPADRFRSAGEMAKALSDPALELESGPAERLRSMTYRGRRVAKRHWRRAVIPAALLGVVAVFMASRRFGTSVDFQERDWILVADFDGPADDPGLANGVRELATAELNQSRFLSTLPRSQLNATMRLAGLSDTTRVGPQLARELAYRSAIRAVLVGSVSHVGRNNYSIVLKAVDADDGAEIWSAAGAASDSNLIPTVQRLAQGLREGLGERRSAIQAGLPLGQIATPSFPAYRLYAEGQRLLSRGEGRASNRVLREALAVDTAFASAWLAMGWNYLNERSLDSARWAFGQAFRRRDRLAEVQRYRLEADMAYAIDYDLPAAIRAYDFFLAHSPRSWSAHNNRGSYLLALGRYEDALESFNNAVASHPFGPQRAQIQVMNQTATLIALGRIAEANRAARDLSGPFALYIRLMLAAAQNRTHEADSVGTAAATAPSSPTWLRVQAAAVAASSHASRGAIRSADARLAQAAVGSSPDAARWFYRARILLALASERRVPPLPGALATDTTLAALVTAALAGALSEDTAAARLALQKAQRASPNDMRRLGSGPQLTAAWLEARGGNWRTASDMIGSTAVRGEHDTALLDRVGSLSLRWFAAEAFARIGRLDAATAVLELAIKPERMPGNEFAQRGLVVTFAHRRLAKWYAAQGRRDDAVRHWRAFVAALTDPDPELAPLITEARLALKELEAA